MSGVPGIDQPVNGFYFAVGFIYSCIAWILLPVGFANLLASGERTWFTRTVAVLMWLLVACSAVVLYAYAMEAIAAFWSDSAYERSQFLFRLAGDHAWVFWTQCISALLPQAWWIPAVRRVRAVPLFLGVQVLAVPWALWTLPLLLR